MIGALVAKKQTARAFEAMNQHNLASLMSFFHREAVFVYPGEVWASGTATGKAAVEEWFCNFFAQYPKIQFEIQQICVENIFAMGGTNVLAVHWNLHLTNHSGRIGHNSGVNIITVKRGKIIHDETFVFDMGENYKLNWAQP
jgi:ketosteroid isomerase-like protein